MLKKLKGTADGQRMPVGRPPLSDEEIEKFATWIDEGATFDGTNVNQNVAEVAAIAKAKLATHEQLSAERAQLAKQNWRLVMPEATADQLESKDFFCWETWGMFPWPTTGNWRIPLYREWANCFVCPPTSR